MTRYHGIYTGDYVFKQTLEYALGSNPTLATKFTDSQGLAGRNQQAILLFGKGLVNKSVFPCQSQAIRFRKIPLTSPQHYARLE